MGPFTVPTLHLRKLKLRKAIRPQPDQAVWESGVRLDVSRVRLTPQPLRLLLRTRPQTMGHVCAATSQAGNWERVFCLSMVGGKSKEECCFDTWNSNFSVHQYVCLEPSHARSLSCYLCCIRRAKWFTQRPSSLHLKHLLAGPLR